jgi:TonB-dependent Receptor Plug Domain
MHRICNLFLKKNNRALCRTGALLFVCCLINFGGLYAQPANVSIQVKGQAKEEIANASISINEQRQKTDDNGFVQILLNPGNYRFQISAVNYFTYNFSVQIIADTVLFAELKPRESFLGNVTVTSSRNVSGNQMSIQSLNMEQIRKLPVILGEIDPLKTITLLPGIKNGGEAGSGLYVRGGGPDQNLVLLDGIPVYNPNHLFGFFSIFNGEAIDKIEVIKGGMPANFGGRLSSVINVSSRNGNKDSLKGSGGIGLISSRFSLEGPIIKGKSSFMLSARRTYIDQVARVVAKSEIGDNGYFFYDINARADYDINDNNQLLFTFYTGDDDFKFADTDNGRNTNFNTLWGNTLAGVFWKQKISNRLQQETGLIYNKFALNNQSTFSALSFAFASGLEDLQVKTDWQFTSNKWLKLQWGLQYIKHEFSPGAGDVTAGVQQFISDIKNQYAHEAAGYITTDIKVTPALEMTAGMRYSYFNQVGPTSRIIYGADGEPTGQTESFKRGESIAAYHYPEPRVSFLYKLPGQASIKASYTRTTQFLHLATTSGATFPSDLWVPSGEKIKPAIAEQVAVGYFKNLDGNKYELSAEAYYKTMSNQIEFRPGAQLLLNQNLEGEMIFGSGVAYGIELFAQKKTGRFTGWIGYTLSRTERTFDELNNGKPFTYRYDRTHDLSIVGNYRLNRKWEMAAVFVYGTGNALTLPKGRFGFNLGLDLTDNRPIFTNINQYDAINDYRMPAYHRLDIAFTYTPKPGSSKRYKSSWNFGIYNVFNRGNPFFIYVDVDRDAQTVEGRKVFLFPIIPSVTWNFKF